MSRILSSGSRRSQITIIMILGLVILAVTGLLIYFNATSQTEADTKDTLYLLTEKKEAEDYYRACAAEQVQRIVASLAAGGGELDAQNSMVWKGRNIRNFAIYSSGRGYVGSPIFVKDIEQEMEVLLKDQLRACASFPQLEKIGFVVSQQAPKPDVMITQDNIHLKSDHEISFSSEAGEFVIQGISSDIPSSFGRLLALAIDISNSEAAFGQFDKDDLMLRWQDTIEVSKYKPYPDIVYELAHMQKDSPELLFTFAIKGGDTAAKEVLVFGDLEGCCISDRDSMCYKNIAQKDCKGRFISARSCRCAKNLIDDGQDALGCCQRADGTCEITDVSGCRRSQSSSFFKADLRCAAATCTNMDCQATYDYVTDDYTGPSKKHGESWCAYEGPVGQGSDYVGTRHHLHTCLDGREYVESCRDFREELCSQGFAAQPDVSSNEVFFKAACRINRWEDCSAQMTQADCENAHLRDCFWNPSFISYEKCVPQVPPGSRHWENENAGVCDLGSLRTSDYGERPPQGIGASMFFYCQKMGDCGNYPNLADVVGKGGYYSPYVDMPNKAYPEHGLAKTGMDYMLYLGQSMALSGKALQLPQGDGGDEGRCNVWKAPFSGDCSLCESSSLHPCTEYRCRSIANNCRFTPTDTASGICSSSGSPVQDQTLEISMRSIEGHSYIAEENEYYKGKELHISPQISEYETLRISFQASKESRCRISPYPPMSGSQDAEQLAVFLPELMLSLDGSYRKDFEAVFRLPPFSAIRMDSLLLFVKCEDQDGRTNKPLILNLKLDNQTTADLAAEIVGTKPGSLAELFAQQGSGPLASRSVIIYTDRPFSACGYSLSSAEFAQMTSIPCSASEDDFIYDALHPDRSFACRGEIQIPQEPAPDRVYLACEAGGQVSATYLLE